MVKSQARELRLFLAGCKFLTREDRMYIRRLLRRFEIDKMLSPAQQVERHSRLEVDLANLAARLELESQIAALEAEKYRDQRTVELMDESDRDVEAEAASDGPSSKPRRPPAAEWRLKRLRSAAGSDQRAFEKMAEFAQRKRLHTMIDKLQWAMSRRGTLIDALIRRER